VGAPRFCKFAIRRGLVILLSGFFSMKTSIELSSLVFATCEIQMDFERLSSLKKPLILAMVGSLKIERKC
jgi:hypothetical protein